MRQVRLREVKTLVQSHTAGIQVHRLNLRSEFSIAAWAHLPKPPSLPGGLRVGGFSRWAHFCPLATSLLPKPRPLPEFLSQVPPATPSLSTNGSPASQRGCRCLQVPVLGFPTFAPLMSERSGSSGGLTYIHLFSHFYGALPPAGTMRGHLASSESRQNPDWLPVHLLRSWWTQW